MGKVEEITPYCEPCIYFREVPYRCEHSSNKVPIPNFNRWLSESEGNFYMETPNLKNEYNKCLHYKVKK